MNDDETFIIKCTMKKRWIPHFLAMLNYMAELGTNKKSQIVSLFADGSGDFYPTFEWDAELSHGGEPVQDESGDRLFDAGIKFETQK